MIKLKVLVSILIWTVPGILECGKKTNNMEKGKRHGLMVQCMKGTMSMGENKV